MSGLYGNDALSILVLSIKKKYTSFLEKVFVFEKICVKVLKTLKLFRLSPIFQTGGYFKNA